MMKIIGVVGAGQMGAGIAQVSAQAGYRVLLSDVDLARASSGKDGIAKGLARLVDKLDSLVDEPDEFVAVDMLFHLRVTQAGKSPMISQFLDDTLRRFQTIRAQYPVGRIDLQQAITNQRETLAALVCREPAVIVDAMHRHLGSVEEHFLGEPLRLGVTRL